MSEKYKPKKEYKLHGLVFPLESGLNPPQSLDEYFEHRTEIRPSEEIILERLHPEYYKKMIKEGKIKTSYNRRD